jgi:hypothetical protein
MGLRQTSNMSRLILLKKSVCQLLEYRYGLNKVLEIHFGTGDNRFNNLSLPLNYSSISDDKSIQNLDDLTYNP